MRVPLLRNLDECGFLRAGFIFVAVHGHNCADGFFSVGRMLHDTCVQEIQYFLFFIITVLLSFYLFGGRSKYSHPR